MILNNRLEKILIERKKQGVTWDDLAKNLPVKGNALRTAFTRKRVDKAYLLEIEEILNITNDDTSLVVNKNLLYYSKEGVKISLDEIFIFLSKHIEAPEVQEKIFEIIELANVKKEVENYKILSKELDDIKKILIKNNLLND